MNLSQDALYDSQGNAILSFQPGGGLVIRANVLGSNNPVTFEGQDGVVIATINQSGVLSTAGGGGGIASFGAVGSAPSANGATVVGTVATLQPADATHPGLVTALTQSLGGEKTFADDVVLTTGGLHAANGAGGFLLTLDAYASGDYFSVVSGAYDILRVDSNAQLHVFSQLTVGDNASYGVPTINGGPAGVLTLLGAIANGATAVGVAIGPFNDYTTAGARVASFKNNNGASEVGAMALGTSPAAWGLVMYSPGGDKFIVTVSDVGVLVVTAYSL